MRLIALIAVAIPWATYAQEVEKTPTLDGAVVSNSVDLVIANYTPPSTEDILKKFVEEKNSTESGRVLLHGKVIAERQEKVGTTNFVRIVYSDGYVHSRVMSICRGRFNGVGKKNTAIQKRLEKNLPSRLKALEKRRREVTSTTNNVTMIQYSNGVKIIKHANGKQEVFK